MMRRLLGSKPLQRVHSSSRSDAALRSAHGLWLSTIASDYLTISDSRRVPRRNARRFMM